MVYMDSSTGAARTHKHIQCMVYMDCSTGAAGTHEHIQSIVYVDMLYRAEGTQCFAMHMCTSGVTLRSLSCPDQNV